MKKKINKVKKHLKEDIKMFKHEAGEDKKLIKELSKKSKKKAAPNKKSVCSSCKKKMSAKEKAHEAKESKGHEKYEKVMREYKAGKLHSGSKKGPKVKKLSQARAIAFSEDRRANKTNKGAKKKKK